MARAKFETYVVHPGTGDPIPRIGSGFRLVQAKVGIKWVRIRVPGEQATRVHKRRWLFDIPHVLYTGQELREVFRELNKWKRT